MTKFAAIGVLLEKGVDVKISDFASRVKQRVEECYMPFGGLNDDIKCTKEIYEGFDIENKPIFD